MEVEEDEDEDEAPNRLDGDEKKMLRDLKAVGAHKVLTLDEYATKETELLHSRFGNELEDKIKSMVKRSNAALEDYIDLMGTSGLAEFFKLLQELSLDPQAFDMSRLSSSTVIQSHTEFIGVEMGRILPADSTTQPTAILEEEEDEGDNGEGDQDGHDDKESNRDDESEMDIDAAAAANAVAPVPVDNMDVDAAPVADPIAVEAPLDAPAPAPAPAPAEEGKDIDIAKAQREIIEEKDAKFASKVAWLAPLQELRTKSDEQLLAEMVAANDKWRREIERDGAVNANQSNLAIFLYELCQVQMDLRKRKSELLQVGALLAANRMLSPTNAETLSAAIGRLSAQMEEWTFPMDRHMDSPYAVMAAATPGVAFSNEFREFMLNGRKQVQVPVTVQVPVAQPEENQEESKDEANDDDDDDDDDDDAMEQEPVAEAVSSSSSSAAAAASTSIPSKVARFVSSLGSRVKAVSSRLAAAFTKADPAHSAKTPPAAASDAPVVVIPPPPVAPKIVMEERLVTEIEEVPYSIVEAMLLFVYTKPDGASRLLDWYDLRFSSHIGSIPNRFLERDANNPTSPPPKIVVYRGPCSLQARVLQRFPWYIDQFRLMEEFSLAQAQRDVKRKRAEDKVEAAIRRAREQAEREAAEAAEAELNQAIQASIATAREQRIPVGAVVPAAAAAVAQL